MRLQFQDGMSEHDKKELHLLQEGFLKYKWCPICKAALSTGCNGKKNINLRLTVALFEKNKTVVENRKQTDVNSTRSVKKMLPI